MASQNTRNTTPGGSGTSVPQSHPDSAPAEEGRSRGFWGGADSLSRGGEPSPSIKQEEEQPPSSEEAPSPPKRPRGRPRKRKNIPPKRPNISADRLRSLDLRELQDLEKCALRDIERVATKCRNLKEVYAKALKEACACYEAASDEYYRRARLVEQTPEIARLQEKLADREVEVKLLRKSVALLEENVTLLKSQVASLKDEAENSSKVKDEIVRSLKKCIRTELARKRLREEL